MKTIMFLLSFVLMYFNTNTFTEVPKHIVQLDLESGKDLMQHYSKSVYRKAKKIYIVEDSILNILKEEFSEIQNVKSSYNSYIKNLDKYAYQVIGFRIKKDNYVYVSAFYIGEDNPDRNKYKEYWRKYAIKGFDGGDKYWRILFNIESKTFSDLHINGPGPFFLEDD